jgi:basic membrane protein A and related proteins
MKQRITILSLLVVGAMFLAACGGAAEAPAADDKIVAVYVIGGTLGDKSFIDSAHRGLTKAQEELGIEYR